MSVQAIAWVLEHSESTRGTRCLFVSIANHVEADGEGWADKAQTIHEARISDSAYSTAMQKLEAAGECYRITHAGGKFRTHERHKRNVFFIPAMVRDRSRLAELIAAHAAQQIDPDETLAMLLRRHGLAADSAATNSQSPVSDSPATGGSDPVDNHQSDSPATGEGESPATGEGESPATGGSIEDPSVDPSVDPSSSDPEPTPPPAAPTGDDDDRESESDTTPPVDLVRAVAHKIAETRMQAVDAHEGAPRAVPPAWLRNVTRNILADSRPHIIAAIVDAPDMTSVDQLAAIAEARINPPTGRARLRSVPADRSNHPVLVAERRRQAAPEPPTPTAADRDRNLARIAEYRRSSGIVRGRRR